MRLFIPTLITGLIIPFSGLLGAAHAVEINTPLIQSGTSTAINYVCRVTNLGKESIEVDIDLIDTSGNVFDTESRTIAPGESEGNFSDGMTSFDARCRVTGGFRKKQVIVQLTLIDDSSDITKLIVIGQ